MYFRDGVYLISCSNIFNNQIYSLPAGRVLLAADLGLNSDGQTTEVKHEKADNCQNKETLVQAKDSESIKPARSDFPGR